MHHGELKPGACAAPIQVVILDVAGSSPVTHPQVRAGFLYSEGTGSDAFVGSLGANAASAADTAPASASGSR